MSADATNSSLSASEKLTVQQRWSDMDAQSDAFSDKVYWLAVPAVMARYQRLACEHLHYASWVEYCIGKFLDPKADRRMLSVGCGYGALERHLASLSAFSSCDAFDIAPAAIFGAKAAAQAEGLSGINYVCADVEQFEFGEKRYDAVWFNGSLHHIKALERVLDSVRRSLKPDGYLFLNEYVGANHFGFPLAQREAMTHAFHLIPPRFRKSFIKENFGQIMEVAPLPDPSEVHRVDPSEAVRSEDIKSVVAQSFDFLTINNCGGTLLQLPVLFDGFPAGGFAAIRRLPDEANKFLGEDIERFWRFTQEQTDCRWSATVLLLSGWGCPHGVAPPIDESKVPAHWQFLPLSFADAAILGACDDGRFNDIFRLLKQQDMLEKQAFAFTNPNGLLNMFGFWKGTKGNLIPEHMWEMQPPCNIVIDVGEIRRPRCEGIRRQDQRVLPLPEGGYKVVQRKDWGQDGLRPIYANVQDLSEFRLSGAVSVAGRTWWIETTAREGEPRSWRYQIWNAIVEWLAAIAPKLIRDHPELFLPGAYRVRIDLPDNAQFHAGAIDSSQPDNIALPETVAFSADDSVVRTGGVAVSVDWPGYLRSAKNIAEVELISATLEGLQLRASRAGHAS